MAKRYHSPLMARECDIFENIIDEHRFVLAHIHDCYFLYIVVLHEDALLIMINTHNNIKPKHAVINEQTFNTLLSSVNFDEYCNALCDNQLTSTIHNEKHKNMILEYVRDNCNCSVSNDFWRITIVFDIPSISLQPYKYVTIFGGDGMEVYLMRGINVYSIKSYSRDLMMLEHTRDCIGVVCIEKIIPIFKHMCKHVDIPPKCAEYILTLRTHSQLEWYMRNMKPDEISELRQIFSMKTHEENYANSIENLYEIINLPRVIFNMILNYL